METCAFKDIDGLFFVNEMPVHNERIIIKKVEKRISFPLPRELLSSQIKPSRDGLYAVRHR